MAALGGVIATLFYWIDMSGDHILSSDLTHSTIYAMVKFLLMVLPLILLFYFASKFMELHRNAEIEKQRLEIEKIESEQFLVLGRLAASIAHEVRNPLNNILLLVDELGRNTEDPAVIAGIGERLNSNAGRINHAVELVYRLARPGEVKHRLESNDYGDIIILFDSLKQGFERDGSVVAITNKTGKKRVLMSGDYDCLQTIFDNLLRNAVSASQNTPVYVDIEEVEESGSIRVVIYNQGALPEAFEIASIEGLSSRKSSVRGLGLGIVIVNELAKQLRMRISYNSDDQVVSFEVVGLSHRGIFDPIEGIDEKDEYNDGSVPRIDS